MKRTIVKSHLRKRKIVRQHSRLIKEPRICNPLTRTTYVNPVTGVWVPDPDLALKKKRYKMGSHKKKAYKKLRSWTPEEEEALSNIDEDFTGD